MKTNINIINVVDCIAAIEEANGKDFELIS